MKWARRASELSSARLRRIYVVFGVAVVVLGLDQLTKSLAVDHLRGAPVHVIGPFSLALGFNSGVAFSLGTGLTLPIVAVVILLVVALVVSARAVPSTSAAVGIGLVLGGALGNLADRLVRSHGGAVVDFVHTSFWPTFNLADSAVVCGCVVLVFVMWRRARVHPSGPSHQPESAERSKQ